MSDLVATDEAELPASATEQFVTLTIDGQFFGLPILKVQDIVESRQITSVPLAPPAIAGVMNLRGRIANVVDLRRCFGPALDESPANRMGVTVEHDGELFTFLVDSIGDVIDVEIATVEAAPGIVSDTLRQLARGVVRHEAGLLVLLDVAAILRSDSIRRVPGMALPAADT